MTKKILFHTLIILCTFLSISISWGQDYQQHNYAKQLIEKGSQHFASAGQPFCISNSNTKKIK